MGRLLGFSVTAPFFNHPKVFFSPVKLLVVLWLAALVSFIVPLPDVVPTTLLLVMLVLCFEFLIGVLIGFIMQLVIIGVELAGTFLSHRKPSLVPFAPQKRLGIVCRRIWKAKRSLAADLASHLLSELFRILKSKSRFYCLISFDSWINQSSWLRFNRIRVQLIFTPKIGWQNSVAASR